MAVTRPLSLALNLADHDGVISSPLSLCLTEDSTASYNLQSHYKTPRPSNLLGNSGDHQVCGVRVGGNSNQFELLRSLEAGERVVQPPPRFSDFAELQKKLFGTTKRRCILEDGYLIICQGKKETETTRIWRKIDLGQSLISYRQSDCIILADDGNGGVIYRLKVKPESFESWLDHLRLHRLYQQSRINERKRFGNSHLVTPLTEYSGEDLNVFEDDARSKKRVEQWLTETQKNSRNEDQDYNEACAIVFDLNSIIKQLESCADSVTNRCTTGDRGFLKIPNRSVFRRLSSFRERRRNNSDSCRKNMEKHSDASLQVPSSTPKHFIRLSSPDIPQMEFGTPSKRSISSDRNDLHHREIWLREEYLRLATDARAKFQRLLQLNMDNQCKLRSLPVKMYSISTEFRNGLVSSVTFDDRLDSSRSINKKPTNGEKTGGDCLTCSTTYYDACDQRNHESADDTTSSISEPSLNNQILRSQTDLCLRQNGTSPDETNSNASSPYASYDTFCQAFKTQVPQIRCYREHLPCVASQSSWSIDSSGRRNKERQSNSSSNVESLEPLSLLQRLCEELEYSDLIDQAVMVDDANTRMALVASFIVSGCASATFRRNRRPYTPFLGETFEFNNVNCGWRYLAEQVANQPSNSACFAQSSEWSWWQTARTLTSFDGKRVAIKSLAPVFLHLNKWQETYSWNKPTAYNSSNFEASDLIEYHGKCTLRCEETGVKCVLYFDKMTDTQRGNVRGAVVDASANVSWTLYGNWTDCLYICRASDGTKRRVWHLAVPPLHCEKYYGMSRLGMALNEPSADADTLLPSTDSRFRPDIRLLEEGHLEASLICTQSLQAIQDQRLKELEHSPLWFRMTENSTWQFTNTYWEAKATNFQEIDIPNLW